MLVKVIRVEATKAIRPGDALRVYRTDIETADGDIVENVIVPFPNLEVGQIFHCEYDAEHNRYVSWSRKPTVQPADFIQQALDLGAD